MKQNAAPKPESHAIAASERPAWGNVEFRRVSGAACREAFQGTQISAGAGCDRNGVMASVKP